MDLNEHAKRNILILKRLKILVPYVVNVKKQRGDKKLIEYLKKPNHGLIDISFIWDRTPQGWEFWQKMNEFFKDEHRYVDIANVLIQEKLGK